jgi:hypothetical protein
VVRLIGNGLRCDFPTVAADMPGGQETEFLMIGVIIVPLGCIRLNRNDPQDGVLLEAIEKFLVGNRVQDLLQEVGHDVMSRDREPVGHLSVECGQQRLSR